MAAIIRRFAYYPKTFYPGVIDQSQAKAVEVKEGFENADVDISGVVAKKAYEISGRVVYADTGEPAEGVMILYGAMSKDRGVMGGWRPSRWVIANATRLNESPPRTCGVNVDARGQFIFENLLPGEYEVRLVSLVYQPGEPQDKGLSKLISGVRQKVSLGGAGHAPITLVVDLSRKEGDQ